MRNEWWGIMHWFIGSSWAQRTWFYLSYKFLWVGSLLGYDFKQSLSWCFELMRNTLKPKKELARTTNVHWLTVLDHMVEPVAPSGWPLGTPRPQRANAGVTDTHRQRQEASESGGGGGSTWTLIAVTPAYTHTGAVHQSFHWTCSEVHLEEEMHTSGGQSQDSWESADPNLFIFLQDVQHVIWSPMHGYKCLPYHCGTNTLTTVIPGSGYTSRSASSAREHERLTTF